jgi:hypothetical protein
MNKRLVFFLVFFCSAGMLFSRSGVRTEWSFPDIPGYITLTCDFHSHTVFSDGTIWPTERVEEAWSNGVDALAITDHVEYRPHKQDVIGDLNRSFEIASQSLSNWPILLIKGGEITRELPVGHYNAIFLTDANPLDKQNYMDAIQEAVKQGAFVFWNHPGWTQPGTKAVWYPEQTELFNRGWVKGIEIANDREYYPEAFQWCLDKNITMLGNSDIHGPAIVTPAEHLNMTLVFVTEKSLQGIKDALLAGRTAVFFQDKLMGREQYLKPLFENSVRMGRAQVLVEKKGVWCVEVYNPLLFDIELKASTKSDIQYAEHFVLASQKSVLLRFKVPEKFTDKEIILPFIVQNFLVAPGQGLQVELKIVKE